MGAAGDTGIVILNNILRNLATGGIQLFGGKKSLDIGAGNIIHHNRIDNIPDGKENIPELQFGTVGFGVYLDQDVGARISENTLTRVTVGILACEYAHANQDAYIAAPPVTPADAGWRAAIFAALRRADAATHHARYDLGDDQRQQGTGRCARGS